MRVCATLGQTHMRDRGGSQDLGSSQRPLSEIEPVEWPGLTVESADVRFPAREAGRIAWSAGEDLDVAGAWNRLPVRADADERADGGFDDDDVHELAVDELLQRQRPQGSQRLAVEP